MGEAGSTGKAYTQDNKAKTLLGGRYLIWKAMAGEFQSLLSERGQAGSVGSASCECVLRPPLLTLPERS